MTTMADLDELALSLPQTTKEVSDDGRPAYLVHGKLFCFHRGRRRDAIDVETGERLDDVLMFRVADLDLKELLLTDDRGVFFTTPHFNGYPAVLMRIPDLARLDREELYDMVVEAWLTRAQKRVAKAWLEEHGAPGRLSDEFRSRASSLLQQRQEELTMPKTTADISISLDGFVAGPNPTLEEPLGAGGEQLHEWVVRLAAWRKPHGLSGGETDADSEMVEESVHSTGAVVMGRRMFSGGAGPWEDDPNADGWWGDDPPFHVPVFVVTHHPRETVEKHGGTTFAFVTDGVEAAVEQARAAAGDKDVSVAGGANVLQQSLAAGLLDEIQVHVAPVLLGDGVRLFDGGRTGRLEIRRVIEAPLATHVRYRVVH
jgi:dihydrofolate reductase